MKIFIGLIFALFTSPALAGDEQDALRAIRKTGILRPYEKRATSIIQRKLNEDVIKCIGVAAPFVGNNIQFRQGGYQINYRPNEGRVRLGWETSF